MNEPWVILTRRYGGDIRNPTTNELADAIAELYHETLPGMTERDYAEHGAAILRCGNDEGPMFVLELSRLHDIRLEEWADQDFEQELGPARSMQAITEDYALQLWEWLAQGEIDRLRSQVWNVT